MFGYTAVGFVFVVLSVIIIYINLRKLYSIYKKARKIYGAPKMNGALEGLYVKFKGTVQTVNEIVDQSVEKKVKRKCEFLISTVKAFWKVKRKKPGQGMEEISKQIYSSKPQEFLVSNYSAEVYIRPETAERHKASKMQIHELKEKFIEPDDRFPANKKYSKYRHHGQYLLAGDEVTIYGHLIKDDGRYVITESYQPDYPFMILLGNYLGFGKIFRGRVLKILFSIALLSLIILFPPAESILYMIGIVVLFIISLKF